MTKDNLSQYLFCKGLWSRKKAEEFSKTRQSMEEALKALSDINP